MATYLSRLGITAGTALAAGLFTVTGAVGVASAAPAEHETVETHIGDENGGFDAIDHYVRTQGNTSDSEHAQHVKTIHDRTSGTFTDPSGSGEFHGTTNTADAVAPAFETTGVSTTTIVVEDETITLRCVGHATITSGYSARSSGTVNNFTRCH